MRRILAVVLGGVAVAVASTRAALALAAGGRARTDLLAAGELTLLTITALTAAWIVAAAAIAWHHRDEPDPLPRGVPRWMRVLLEVALAAVLVPAPAASASPSPNAPSPGTPAAVLVDVPVVRAPTPPPATSLPATSSVPHDPASPVHPPPVPTATVHVVEPGESLWTIARARLATDAPALAHGRPLARYWWRVVAANRGRLRSGDPDVIFSGEQIVCPPA